MHSFLNHPPLQNFRYPHLGLRRHQRLVQVKIVAARCCNFWREALNSQSLQRLECPGKSELGVFWNQPGAAIACIVCRRSHCPQNDAGYISGSSIAAAALGFECICDLHASFKITLVSKAPSYWE
jgi:hypothetical protein